MSPVPPIWIVLVGYAVVQTGIVLFLGNGPFVDESSYTAAGLRVLSGFGLSDGYFSWFSGCPMLWPALAGLGYKMAGLAGARLLAVGLSTVTLWAVAGAASGLFGESVGLWTAIALGLNGYFIALGHFAVHDVLALTSLSLAFWFVVRYARTAQPKALWAAALTACAATLAKYAFGVMLLPLLIVLLALRRTRSISRDGFIFVGLSALGLLSYWLLFQAQLAGYAGIGFFSQAGVYGRPKIFYSVLYPVAGPALFGALGALTLWRSGRGALGLALWWPLLIWPAFHVVTLNNVSLSKHVVIGILFTAPLLGVCLDWLWRKRNAWLAVGVTGLMALLGGGQWYLLEHSWEAMQPAVDYVRSRYKPSDHLVVAINSWSFGLDFYSSKVVDDPRFPTNQYQLAQTGDVAAVCQNNWLVEDGYVRGVSALLSEAIAQCPYRLAFHYSTPTYAVSDDGRWAKIPHDVNVYVRSEKTPQADR